MMVGSADLCVGGRTLTSCDPPKEVPPGLAALLVLVGLWRSLPFPGLGTPP